MNKKIILGILISIVLIYLSARGINFQDVIRDIQKVQLSYVALSILFMILMQWLRSYRWGVILQPLEKIGQFPLFSVTCVGLMAIAAIPARLGELARPYLISKKSSIKMSSALGTIIVERALDGFSVLTIAVVIIAFIDLPGWLIKSSILFFIVTLLMFCGIAGLIWRRDAGLRIINRILHFLPGKLGHKIDEIIHHFIDGFQVVTNIRSLIYLFALSALVWLVDVAAIYMMLKAFGFPLPVIASFVVMVVLIIGIALPAAPGFIGTWHYSCILGLSLFGISQPEALSFAIVYHFLAMLIVLVLGVIFLPFNKFSLADMKTQMGQEKKVQGSR